MSNLTTDRDTIHVEDETLRQGFTTIPNAVLKRPDLSPGAKLCYVMLLTYAWQDDRCFPGQWRLGADIGCGERSVQRYLKELQDAALITVKRRGLGMTNVYILHRLARGAKTADQDSPKDQGQKTPHRRTTKTQVKKLPSQKEKDQDAYRRSAEAAGFDAERFFDNR